ncbi:MAG: ribonuclease E/G, partial [Fervidobacterium sp.]
SDVEQVITNSYDLKELIRRYNKNVPVKVIDDDPFETFGIYNQIKKALERTHELPSGGEIVIDKTEALTIIDVNSGHFVDSQDHEELSRRINVEAAREICRLLRVRNIGGIILVDFIDMRTQESKEDILRVIRSEIAKDKNKIDVYGFTQLGLLEMARKRISKSLDERLTAPCPVCGGTGHVLHPKYIVEKLLSEVNNKPRNAKEVIIKLHPSFKSLVSKEKLKDAFNVNVHMHFTHLDPSSYELIWKI